MYVYILFSIFAGSALSSRQRTLAGLVPCPRARITHSAVPTDSTRNRCPGPPLQHPGMKTNGPGCIGKESYFGNNKNIEPSSNENYWAWLDFYVTKWQLYQAKLKKESTKSVIESSFLKSVEQNTPMRSWLVNVYIQSSNYSANKRGVSAEYKHEPS